MGCGSVLKDAAVSTFLEYDTPKTVHIRSRFIGILNRVVQVAIISYVVGYVFIVHKGYQYIDNGAVSGTTTKLKGVAYTNASDDPRVGEMLWDTADLNVPPEENNAFFVTTNIIVTHNQTQGECADNSWNTKCVNDSDCEPAGTPIHLAHGVSTGRCDKSARYCIVKAWCPVENDDLPVDGKYATLEQTKDWTVMIKNHVYFPHYEKTRSNVIESITQQYIYTCNYHHEKDPYCPIFKLKDIVSLAETKKLKKRAYKDKWYEALAIEGGVISIQIKWDCNFDVNETECKPSYEFDRLDKYKGNDLGSGYNFRYPIYYYEDGIRKRNLVKAFGILFIIEDEARGRAFDLVTFALNLGSGIALLGMAALCCDIFLMYLHRKKDYFKKHIFHDITREPEDDTKSLKSKFTRSSTNFTDCTSSDENGERQTMHPSNGIDSEMASYS